MAPYRELVLTGLAVVASVMINSGWALSRQNVNVGAAGNIVPAVAAPQTAFEPVEVTDTPGHLEPVEVAGKPGERAPVEVADKPAFLALARYLSHRYRIATESAHSVVNAAYDAGDRFGLDPLLLLAVMAIESRFNPVAQSVMGAKGLMQIMPKQHRDKLLTYGGENAVLDPTVNIRLGAQILKEYIDRGGSLKAGLRSYNGAQSDAASLYTRKVIAERARLQGVLREPYRMAHDDPVKLAHGGPGSE